MFGTISSFLWKYVAGLTATLPGWKRIQIAPSVGEKCDAASVLSSQLTQVSSVLNTTAGLVQVGWDSTSLARAQINVSIPGGAISGATVVVPCVGAASVVRESGRTIWQNGRFVHGGSPRVTAARQHGSIAVAFEVRRGSSLSFERS